MGNTSPGERLRQARVAARFATAADAARRFGWNVETYKSHENGARGIRADVATKYANAFGVEPAWLLYGHGRGPATEDATDGPAAPQPSSSPKVADAPPPAERGLNIPATTRLLPLPAQLLATAPKDLPVLGMTSGGGKGWYFLQETPVAVTNRPPQLTGVADAYALDVDGDSMAPRFWHGERVYIHPHRKVQRRDYVVVQLEPEEGDQFVRCFLAEFVKETSRMLIVRKLNPPQELRFPRKDVRVVHYIELSGRAP